MTFTPPPLSPHILAVTLGNSDPNPISDLIRHNNSDKPSQHDFLTLRKNTDAESTTLLWSFQRRESTLDTSPTTQSEEN